MPWLYRPALALGLAGALVLSPVPPPPLAQAATFTVTITQDAPHTTPLDGNCTSTLPGAPCTLRAAVQAANLVGGTQTINLAMAGTYTLAVTGQGEDNAATGDLDVNYANLAIANTSGGTVTIDGNGIDRVFEVGPVAAAQLSLYNLIVRNGVVGDRGGGIRVVAGSTLALTGVTVSHNHSDGLGGGGIYNGGTTIVDSSSIEYNQAWYGPSGGQGGGITNAGTLTMMRSAIHHNEAQLAIVPGANYCYYGGNGGGIYNTGTVTLENVTISNNEAAGNLCELSFNNFVVVPGYGGGIYMAAGSATLSFVTTAENEGRTGSSIFKSTGATVTLKASILGKLNPGNPGNCSGGSVTSQGDNIARDGTCGLTGPGDRQNADPLLGPLQNNGGPTLTHALLAGSPAIDGVQHNACPPPTTDQRAYFRPAGAGCDIGAHEANAHGTPTATPIPTATPVACAVRLNVVVVALPDGSGRLRATIIAQTDAYTRTNALVRLQFGAATGALIDIGTLSGQTGNFSYTPLAGTPSVSFTVRQQTPGQAATVPVVVTDNCGDWPTLVGGGPSAFATPASGPAAAPATPSPTPGRVAIASTPAPSPTPAAVCAPRPTIAVATAPEGAGRLRVTLTAPASANDRLLALRFGAASNARIDAGGQSGAGSFTVSLPPSTQQTSFTVTRVTAGQAVTVPLTVIDSCGEWPTVLGGGPSAF